MNGNFAEKLGRLVGSFASNPGYLTRYVSHNVLNRRTPLDLEIPWFSYAAIDFLEKVLQPGFSVFEYGSGGSTLFFAQRVKSVFSVEDNSKWFKLVTEHLRERGMANADVQLFPFDFKNPVGFDHSAYLHGLPDRHFDLYVIDGSEEWEQVRPLCFQHIESKVRPAGIVVVDDSWRYPLLRAQSKARYVKTFEGVGPGRPGVTSTDIFFY